MNKPTKSGRYNLPPNPVTDTQCDREEHSRERAKLTEEINKESKWMLFWLALFIISGLVSYAMYSNYQEMLDYDDDEFTSSEWIMVIVVGCIAGMLSVLSGAVRLTGGKNHERQNLLDRSKTKARQSFLTESASKKNHVSRCKEYVRSLCTSGKKSVSFVSLTEFVVAYSHSFLALCNHDYKSMFYIAAEDIEEVRLDTREDSRTTKSTLSSSRSGAFKGAALGTLLFGDEGMDAGAIIGAAGERETESSTQVSYKHEVTIFTSLRQLPQLTLKFGSDLTAAKNLYAVLQYATDNPQR